MKDKCLVCNELKELDRYGFCEECRDLVSGIKRTKKYRSVYRKSYKRNY